MSSSYIKGAACLVFSAFNFALMAALAHLAGDVPFVEKAFFRNIVAVFVTLFILIKNRSDVHVPQGALKFLILRGLCGSAGIFGNFYALDRIPIADAAILNKMSPFFAVVFSLFLIGEKIKAVPMAATIGAFLGALFVIKPGAAAVHSLPALAGFLGGMGAGFAYACVRKLGSMKTPGALVIAFFSCFSCALCLPFMLVSFKTPAAWQLLCLLGAGVAGCLGQFGITYAYFFAPARDISIYDYSQIIFSSLLGFVMFNQIPDALSWIGYAVIVLMAAIVFVYNKKCHVRA
ncbi:MAG: DMT family transporter [Treponema sp.]|nr:DMT family transporter [Treponema sp.]